MLPLSKSTFSAPSPCHSTRRPKLAVLSNDTMVGREAARGRERERIVLFALSSCSLPLLLPSRGLLCDTLEAPKHLLESFMDTRCSVDYPGAGVPP